MTTRQIPDTSTISQLQQGIQNVANDVGDLATLWDATQTSLVESINNLKAHVDTTTLGGITLPNNTWWVGTLESGSTINILKVTSADDPVAPNSVILGSTLLPAADNTINLGSASVKFSEIHATTVYAGTLVTSLSLPNDTYLVAAKATTGTTNLIKANTDDNTVLNSVSSVFFAIAGTNKLSMDSSGNLVPASNNTSSLGSSSFKFANVYSANSYTNILGTIDTATTISGGESASAAAGSYIQLSGINYGGAGLGGHLTLFGGNGSYGDVILQTANSHASIKFTTGGSTTIEWSGSSLNYMFGQNHSILATGEHSNELSLNLCGGSSAASSTGAFISLYGKDNVAAGGKLLLQSGNYAAAPIEINAYNATGSIAFKTGNALRWTINANGHLIPESNLSIGSEAGPVGSAYITTANITTANVGSVSASAELPLSGSSIAFKISGTTNWSVDASGHLVPASDGNRNLGSSLAKIGTVYTNNVVTSAVLGLSGTQLQFKIGDTVKWSIISSGPGGAASALVPATNGTMDIGAVGSYVSVLYANGVYSGTSLFLSGSSIALKINDITKWSVNSSGHLIPENNGSQNIGGASNYVNNAYVTTANINTAVIATSAEINNKVYLKNQGVAASGVSFYRYVSISVNNENVYFPIYH